MAVNTNITPDLGIQPFNPQEVERQQWLEERRKGLGGSDVHNLFPDESKYGCELRLWFDKTGKPEDYQRTEAELKILDRGNRLENVVASLYQEETGRQVYRVNKPYVSEEHSWARVNVDRRIRGDERGPGVLECKTASPWILREIKQNGLPIGYALQVHHALLVTGYKWGSIAIYEAGSGEFLFWDIERDEGMIQLLVKKGAEFWAKVENFEQPLPLPDAKDKRCSSCQWRKTCRGEMFAAQNAALAKEIGSVEYVEDNDAELAELCNDRKTVKTSIEQNEALLETIDERIKAKVGERQAVKVPGAQVAILWKQQKGASRWDSKALEADHPELAEKYKKVSAPTRPFKVVSLEMC